MKGLWVLFLAIILCMGNIAHAQIFWPNPGFEGSPCGGAGFVDADTIIATLKCPFYGTKSCRGYYLLPSDSLLKEYYYSPSNVIQERTVLVLGYFDNTVTKPNYALGEISTRVSCTLKANRTYSFTVFAASPNVEPNFHVAPRFQLNSVLDSCTILDTLFESGYIDTVWRNYQVVFTAKTDGDLLQFSAMVPDTETIVTRFMLDSLTPILPHNGNDVRSNMNDTVVKTPECFVLTASTNISTYDTVYWKDSSGAVLAPGFDGGTVCPQASTYYVIAMRDSVPDCAGYWWSYDTVRIGINPALGVEDVREKDVLQVYPTRLQQGQALTIISPASGMMEVYTIDGKKAGTYYSIEKGKQQLIPEHAISSQMLMLRFYMSDGSITFRKVILN